MNPQDILRLIWHAAVVAVSFGVFFGIIRIFSRRVRARTIAFVSAVPTWLLLPFHPVAIGCSLGGAWLGYLMERGPGAFPSSVSRQSLDPEAWEAADRLTNSMFGTFWYRHAVLIFLVGTLAFNYLFESLWFAGFSLGSFFVVGMFGFGYGSTIGMLFRRRPENE